MPGSSGHYRPETYGDRIADVYDDFYGDGLQTSETVEFLADLVGDGPALELGIGTGRVALPLSDRGVSVHGIDASQAMVDRMRAKPGGAVVPVSIGDMADVDAPGDDYSLIYVVFNTFYAMLTQEDQVRCFAGVAQRLVPGGRFVLRGFIPDLERYSRRQSTTVIKIDADEVRTVHALLEPINQTVKSQYVVVKNGATVTYPAFLRYCWPGELNLMARLANLELEARWSDWSKTEFTSASGMLISVYRKPD